MKKILIAGGNGFVGKNMQNFFHGKYEIVVLDINESGLQSKDITFYQTDMKSVDRLNDIFKKESPDYIINLISVVTAERDLSLFDSMIDINFKVFMNLYEASKTQSQLKLFVQFGSAEEYGNIPSPMKESDREEPSSPYALVKQLTTNTAMMLHKNYDFPVCSVRPGNLFGPFQGKNKFIPYIISSLKENETLNVSPCEQKRDFIHIEDFIACIESLLFEPDKSVGEIINISSGMSITLKEIILFCKDQLDSTSKINWGAVPYRENEMMDFSVDVSRIAKININFEHIDLYKRLIQETKK